MPCKGIRVEHGGGPKEELLRSVSERLGKPTKDKEKGVWDGLEKILETLKDA